LKYLKRLSARPGQCKSGYIDIKYGIIAIMKTMHISLLGYHGCMGMQVFGLCDTLQLANRIARAVDPDAPPLFKVTVMSLHGASVIAAGGLAIGTARSPRMCDLLVVPGMELGELADCLDSLKRLAPEVAFVKRAFARGTPLAAVCTGAFVLGEAGLLDGRGAATSWLFASALAQRFPAARVDPGAILLEDGGITTSGAFSATFDLALHLIRRAASPKVLRAVARVGLLDAQRASQAAYIDNRMLPAVSGNFAASVLAWQLQRLAEPYDLNRLAGAFHVSARTLLRRVKDQTGRSPLCHFQQARVGQAKRLLEESALSVAQITERTGYLDVATFGSLFKRIVGLSPAEYRRRFRTNLSQ
jgi:transcriptional regulator GlxA family with amidase domain